MLSRLCKEDFEPLLGRTVSVNAGGSNADLEVKEVVAIPGPSPRATTPFRLVLRSREGWRAAQGIFRVQHPTLGALDVFSVPIGPDAEGLCYEIIFN
ncbi:MAG TPA: hypothetical protein VLB69_09915 [Rudaea sp.]|nr:hypothetical protein [Rudaea sp.]